MAELLLYALNAWEYCPRRFYLEFVWGERQENEHLLLGQYLHEAINEPGDHREGETVVHQQAWVWSDRLQIRGIIDAVEVRHGQLIPLEYKKGKMARHLNDHFQLCAAALCLEERTGQAIPAGEIFYHGNRRRQRVDFTPQLRQATEEAIAAALTATTRPIPPPIDHPKKCQACSLVPLCLPREVRHLHPA
ncbi:CRISPR-associated protein Cas4 [Spirulina major]|uniref:CRISPR-associated protein Cas4 n=1 Tax=Spirulina major TaxID=270636 RepID=UPI0009350E90|nr:CRISPR-associated protein Cas4 [Spirulina major]